MMRHMKRWSMPAIVNLGLSARKLAASAPCPPSTMNTFARNGGTAQERLCSPSVHIPLAAHPSLDHLQRHGTIVVGGLGKSAVVALLDPGLIGPGAVAGQGQPHQPARGLARQLLAVEQHLAKQRLRLMLALLRGQAEPA